MHSYIIIKIWLWKIQHWRWRQADNCMGHFYLLLSVIFCLCVCLSSCDGLVGFPSCFLDFSRMKPGRLSFQHPLVEITLYTDSFSVKGYYSPQSVYFVVSSGWWIKWCFCCCEINIFLLSFSYFTSKKKEEELSNALTLIHTHRYTQYPHIHPHPHTNMKTCNYIHTYTVTHGGVQKDPSTVTGLVILHQNLCNKEQNSGESGLPSISVLWLSTTTSIKYMDLHLNVIDQEHNRVLSQSQMKIQLALTVCFLMKFWAPLSSDQKYAKQRTNECSERESEHKQQKRVCVCVYVDAQCNQWESGWGDLTPNLDVLYSIICLRKGDAFVSSLVNSYFEHKWDLWWSKYNLLRLEPWHNTCVPIIKRTIKCEKLSADLDVCFFWCAMFPFPV